VVSLIISAVVFLLYGYQGVFCSSVVSLIISAVVFLLYGYQGDLSIINEVLIAGLTDDIFSYSHCESRQYCETDQK